MAKLSALLALFCAVIAATTFVYANGSEGSSADDEDEMEKTGDNAVGDDAPLMPPVRVDLDKKSLLADQRETHLFEVENRGLAIKIWNHSRLPAFFTIALITDQLFTITRKHVTLNNPPPTNGDERSSQRLFDAIRNAAQSFYDAELKKPENKDLPTDERTLDALIALQYCNVYRAVLHNASRILGVIIDDFEESETLRRDFFHFDEFRRFQRRKRVGKLQRRLANHIANKYVSFSALIRKRVPTAVLNRLTTEGDAAVPRIHFADYGISADDGKNETNNDGKEEEEEEADGGAASAATNGAEANNSVDNGEDGEDDDVDGVDDGDDTPAVDVETGVKLDQEVGGDKGAEDDSDANE